MNGSNLKLKVLGQRGRYSMVEFGRWKGLYDPAYPKVLDLLKSDELLRCRTTRLLKLTPNLVAEVPLDSELKVVVKDYGWRNFLHFWASPLVKSKALRSLEAATYLLENGLLTPCPLGAFEQRNEGLVEKAYFIAQSLGETNNVRGYLQLCPEGEKGRRRILALLGEYVKKMHDSGLVHRDLTLANFLIQGQRLYLVDLTRARIRTRISCLQRIEDIAKMELAPADRADFFHLYWGGEKGGLLWYKILCLRTSFCRFNRRLRKLRRRIRRSFQQGNYLGVEEGKHTGKLL